MCSPTLHIHQLSFIINTLYFIQYYLQNEYSYFTHFKIYPNGHFLVSNPSSFLPHIQHSTFMQLTFAGKLVGLYHGIAVQVAHSSLRVFSTSIVTVSLLLGNTSTLHQQHLRQIADTSQQVCPSQVPWYHQDSLQNSQ